jgi:predicted Zn-dependent peptidase
MLYTHKIRVRIACACLGALSQGISVYSMANEQNSAMYKQKEAQRKKEVDQEINAVKKATNKELKDVASGARKRAVIGGAGTVWGGMLTDIAREKFLQQTAREATNTLRARLSANGLALVKQNYGARLFPYLRLVGPLALTLGSLAYLGYQPIKYWRERQRIKSEENEKLIPLIKKREGPNAVEVR